MMGTKSKKISVVIPSYKPGTEILTCLKHVIEQETDVEYDITVVDSSPEDPSEMIKSHFPDVEVIHLKKRTYPGKARSKGAELARGDIVCFTDVDCIVDKNWINQLLNTMKTGYKIVGGSVVNGTPNSLFGTAEYIVEFRKLSPGIRPSEVTDVASCNLAVDREVFKKVGYFPDFMKGEDTIFCEYAISAGYKVFFNPNAKIKHMNRTSFMGYFKNQIYLGEGGVEATRLIKREGGFLLTYPFLLPLLPFYRTLMIIKCFLSSDIKLLFVSFLIYPVILLGLAGHVWGFIRGPYRSGISTEMKKN